jgi:hypothetical protein
MASITRLSAFRARLDALLQKVATSDLSDADRDLCVRQAMAEYSRDYPRRRTAEFAGAANSYYLLYGRAVDVSEAGRDAGIKVTSSGADQQLGIKFTLTRAMDVHQVALWLSRTGATLDGTMKASLYTDAAGAPSRLIVDSSEVDIDDYDGAPQGRYARVMFPLPRVFELAAGTYHAVLSTSGYTHVNGSAELLVGVDQGDVTNTVSTYNGSAWSAYGTASAGIIEVTASLPGWREGSGGIVSVEYPAADTSLNEEPQLLDGEDYGLFETEQGTWLRLYGYSPASTETVRLVYSTPYRWVEAADAAIDLPDYHFEAVCNLAGAAACEWLATGYGQKREPSISADSVERRTQSDVYLSLANHFRKAYRFLIGEGKRERLPGMAIVDIDLGPSVGNDFLFHRKGGR